MNTNDIFNFNKDIVSLTNVGLVRKENEDNFGYANTPNGHVFVVCDGMGGHVGGKVASETAVNAIMSFFSSKILLNIPAGMAEAIKYANKAVYEKAQQNPQLKGMGTTIVLTVIKEDKVYIGHVGDSRIYLLTDNKLIRLTKDHSYVQELFNRGIITDEEMRHHSRKNEITKALGLSPDVEPEIAPKPLLLKNGDTLLMCSDGLTDMVDDANIREILITSKNIQEAGQKLINMALTAGGKDNVTLQIIKITNSNYKESIYVNQNNTKDETLHQVTLIDEKPEMNFSALNEPSAEKKFNFKDPKIIAAVFGALLLLALALWFFLGQSSSEENKKTTSIEKQNKTAGKASENKLDSITEKVIKIFNKNPQNFLQNYLDGKHIVQKGEALNNIANVYDYINNNYKSLKLKDNQIIEKIIEENNGKKLYDYKITVDKLKEINKIKNPDNIKANAIIYLSLEAKNNSKKKTTKSNKQKPNKQEKVQKLTSTASQKTSPKQTKSDKAKTNIINKNTTLKSGTKK